MILWKTAIDFNTLLVPWNFKIYIKIMILFHFYIGLILCFLNLCEFQKLFT